MTAIADLLFSDPENAAATISRRITEVGLAAVAPLAGGDVTRQVADALTSQLLQRPVGDLIFSAWEKQQAVQRACDETRGNPGATRHVVVAQHTLKSIQHSDVQVEFAGQNVPMLNLDVTLRITLRIESVVIHVRAGRVIDCGLGNASSRVELGIARPGDGHTYWLVQKDSPAIALPPNVDLDDRLAR